MKKSIEERQKSLEDEVRHLREVEYGVKELLHGILIGIIIGFGLAWFVLK